MKISIEQIKKEMPDNLTAIEEVRYIYLKLGNIMAYNRDFLNITDYRVIKNLYSNSITLSMIEKGDYQNKINATCKQHAEIVAEVINEFKKNNLDISARTIGYVEGEEKHIKVIVTVKGKNYCLDINKDLYKIQKGMKTEGFAKHCRTKEGVVCDVLSEDELKTMDEKIGYCKYGMYTDDILELLRQEMEQEKKWEQYSKGKVRTSAFQYKLDFIFKHLKNNQLEQDEMEIFEISKYYKMLYYRLFTKEERDENFLNTIDIVINKNGKKEKSILYEIQREQGNLYYIYSHEEKTFIEITKEEIIDLQEKRILHYENFIRPDFEDQEGYR